MATIPLIFLCCLGHGNFWLSTIALSTHILFSGGYHSTAVTMLENSVSEGKTSNIVSAWQLYTNLAQTFSPILFSFIGTYFQIFTNSKMFGNLMILFVVGGYLPAALCFYYGGKRYAKEYELKN